MNANSSNDLSPGSFGGILRARLLALMLRGGTNPTNLSIAMGHAGSTLGRKLDGRRRLCTADVEEVLAKLDQPAEALFRPVLLDGDKAALEWVWSRQRSGAVAFADEFTTLHGERLDRLAAQALLRTVTSGVDGVRSLTLTETGIAAVLV